MASNLYVGNISFSTTEDRLREVFGAHGEVVSANIITDRETGRSRGFGFVEMATQDGANAAITALNGQQVDDRTIKVDHARPRRERGGGGDRDRRSRRW
jgi:RNA recognition motif-containing protein